MSAGTKQLFNTLQRPAVDFDKYSSVPFSKLIDVEIPQMRPRLLRVLNELINIPVEKDHRLDPKLTNFLDCLSTIILKDVIDIIPNQDRSVFAEIKKERVTLMTGQKCLNGMSIHEFATYAEGTIAAVSDADLTSNYNLLRSVTRDDIRYEAADVIVDPLQFHIYQEISRLIHANLITKREL